LAKLGVTNIDRVLQIDTGTFTGDGGSSRPAIGTGVAAANSLNHIDSIIVNEGYFDVNSAGVATGRATSSRNASMGSIVTTNCHSYSAYASYIAAIGGGDGMGGRTEVGAIEIHNGTYSIRTNDSPGIETDRASDGGTTSGGSITIHGGNFTIRGDVLASGIGAGVAMTEIAEGIQFNLTLGLGGTGIGNAASRRGRQQSLGSITINRGQFNMNMSRRRQESAVDMAEQGARLSVRSRSRVEISESRPACSRPSSGRGFTRTMDTLGLLVIANGPFALDTTKETRSTAIGGGFKFVQSRVLSLSITGDDFDLAVAVSAAGIGCSRTSTGNAYPFSIVDSMTVCNARLIQVERAPDLGHQGATEELIAKDFRRSAK
jgi:hypothetical protein